MATITYRDGTEKQNDHRAATIDSALRLIEEDWEVMSVKIETTGKVTTIEVDETTL